jgi:NAD dependent epimerase/dehydratase
MAKKKSTILVTGADGFIGSHLTELLLAKGYRVRALCQYNSFNFWGWLEDVNGSDKLEIVNGDVRDPNYCKVITKDIETVFHLAALIAIPYSYVAPASYIDTNIKGTLNICQASVENGVNRVIQMSTSEVYGTAKYVPIDELHPLQPQSPYSASKIGADAVAMSFFNAFNLPVTIARPFNTYGPRQSARAIIPSIISQIAIGMQEIQIGDVKPTRDFSYVEDTCRGLLDIASTNQTVGETINIGSNHEIAIEDIFYLICELMSVNVKIRVDERRLRPNKSEVFRLWCDNAKLKQLTGFNPLFDLRAGLKETIAWFTRADKLAKYKAGIYNI